MKKLFIDSILRLPRRVKGLVFLNLDIITCYLSVWVAFGVRLDEWIFFDSTRLSVFWVAIFISIPLFLIHGLYREVFRFIGTAAFKSIIRVFKWYFIIFFCILYVFPFDKVPRSIGVIQPLLYFLSVGVIRYIARSWLGYQNRIVEPSSAQASRVLIYGAGSAGRSLASILMRNNEPIVFGFIDDDDRLHGGFINGLPVFGGVDIKRIIKENGVTGVLLALPSAAQSQRNEIIERLSKCNVRVRTIPSMANLSTGAVRVNDLNDLDMNDLLGREPVAPSMGLMAKNIQGLNIVVTGAGGSIGSELCRQIIKLQPNLLILIDISEHSLYLIYEELKKEISDQIGYMSQPEDGADSTKNLPVRLIPYLASVRDADLIRNIFTKHQPTTVFHAAAYKHVPLVEQNPIEGIRNNLFGTLNCAQVSLETDVSHFILISTDKAVRPTNIMGASKRISEMALQAMAENAEKNGDITCFSIVRFGNVLGSSGSVAPLFSAQIKAGGPITLTHPKVTRYFMTIPEAAQLVIQSSAMALGGDVFVLDMGEPIRIYDLAVKMVYLSGLMLKDELNPYGDIEIQITGLRAGEKLYEELLIGDNPWPTDHPKIMKAHEEFLPWSELELELENLNFAMKAWDYYLIKMSLKKLVPGYQPNSGEGGVLPEFI